MTVIHHIAFRCEDLDRTERFYRELFGLKPYRVTPAGSRWISLGENTVLMLEQRAEGEPPLANGAMDFFALATDSSGLVEFAARCAKAGISIEHSTEFTVYVRDPDGRRVGASSYQFESEDCPRERGFDRVQKK